MRKQLRCIQWLPWVFLPIGWRWVWESSQFLIFNSNHLVDIVIWDVISRRYRMSLETKHMHHFFARPVHQCHQLGKMKDTDEAKRKMEQPRRNRSRPIHSGLSIVSQTGYMSMHQPPDIRHIQTSHNLLVLTPVSWWQDCSRCLELLALAQTLGERSAAWTYCQSCTLSMLSMPTLTKRSSKEVT